MSKSKTVNTFCLISTILLVATTLFAVILLVSGKISSALSSDSNGSLGEGIGMACAAVFCTFFVLFAVVAHLAAATVSVVALVTSRKRAVLAISSVVSVLLCVFAAVLFVSSATLVFQAINKINQSDAVLVLTCFFLSIIADVFSAATNIAGLVIKNKEIAKKRKEEKLANQTENNNTSEKNAICSGTDNVDNKKDK